MSEIDWKAAKSGKRPVRDSGDVGRYVGQIAGNRHVIAFRDLDGGEYVETYSSDGLHFIGKRLIQDPEVIEFKRWVNVYEDVMCGPHMTREDADIIQSCDRIAAVQLTIRITGDKVEIFGGTE